MNRILATLLPAILAAALAAGPARAADPVATPATASAPAAPATPAAAPAAVVPVKAAPPVAPAVVIGYVDMAKIGADSKPGKAAMRQMKEKTEKYRAQITGREKKLEKLKEEIKAQLPSLSPKERQAKARDFQKKIEEYQKFVQKAEKEMREREQELTAGILKSVEKIAQGYGKANGLAVIIPKQQLLFLGDGVELKDVTEAVLKQLDEPAPAK